jgi:hypothetical protein
MAFADPWPSCPPTSCLNFTVRDASATSLNLTVRLAGVAVKSTTLSLGSGAVDPDEARTR